MSKYVYRPLEVEASEITDFPEMPELVGQMIVEEGGGSVIYPKDVFEKKFVKAE